MSATEIWLKRISIAEIGILDEFALDETDLDFAGGTAKEVGARITHHPCPEDHCLFLIYYRDDAVGFLCLREGRARPEWCSQDAMTLHNLRIGRSWRRSGFARKAICASLRWIAQHRPDTCRLELSVNAQNEQAMLLYHQCGFTRTGALHAGRLGPEIIMATSILRPARPIAEVISG
jgi:ribosomal protein S18 acetylase RimI-like enzyme